MTPKEKAKELIKKHTIFLGDNGALEEYWTDELDAKRHSIITVNEIINYHESLYNKGLKDVYIELSSKIKIYNDVLNPSLKYLQEVKREIEKL